MKTTMKFKPRDHSRKMSSEELQSFLKVKKQGNGTWRNKKAYDRKQSKKIG